MELQSPTAVPDPSSKYVLTSAKNEKQRLSDQHELVVKTIYGGRLIYDQSVKIAATDCVLDSGTGTGSWITDLSKEVPDTTQLVGIDIFVGLVPSTPPSNIQFLEASATKLPEDWTARYNFVHQRLLFGALTATEWKIALNEMFRVLKPGGSIQLAEIASPDWANGGDEERLMQAAASALWKDRGLLLECGKIIPDILKDAGFVDIRTEFRPLPLGQGAGHLGKLGSASIIGAYRGMKKPIAEAKGYGLIESGEQWDEILQNVEKGWDENPGRTVTFVVICAKKSDA